MTETGFVKAQSDKLPKIDAFMVTAYFTSNPDYTSAEIKGVKAASYVPAAAMEHGAKECVEEQSRRETAIAVGVQSAAYIDTERCFDCGYPDESVAGARAPRRNDFARRSIRALFKSSRLECFLQITATNTKEEPGLVELVKSEAALLVKEEVVEDGWRDMDRQACLQATYTPAITTSMNVVAGGVFQDDMKEEWADSDMDVGPTVLQPMDTPYRPVQPDVSIIKEEGRNEDNNINPTQSSGVKEDTIEDEPRAKKDAQRSNKAGQSKQQARSQLYSCDECAKTYASKASLMDHYRNRHSTESHKCTKCNKIFPSKSYLHRHTITAHSEQQYECAVCKKILRSKTALRLHVRQAHRPRPAVVHTCEYCHKTYASKKGLSYHIEVVHTKSLNRCSECNKEYKGKHLLQGHIRRVHSKEEHEGSKPRMYTCDYCKKMFTDKGNIRRHIAHLHSSGSYTCYQCNKIFKCKVYLMSHKTTVHTAGSKARIYTCDYCKKMFTDRRDIQSHITLVHSSGSYKCQCNKIFKCKPYLMRHKTTVHTAGSRQQFTCSNCGKNYKSKCCWKKHEKSCICTRHTASNTSAVASTSVQQPSVIIVKEEPADGELELGPVVFQHMDCNYRPYKQEPGLD